MNPNATARLSAFATLAACLLLECAVALAGDGVLVNGVVKDGSGQGWPLYARLVVTGPEGFPGATVYTDPATGYYSLILPAGASYDFAVTAVGPGYVAGGGPLSLSAQASPASPDGLVANWFLRAGATCSAPGYGPGQFVGAPALSEAFNSGAIPPGWTVDTTSGVSWDVYAADPCGQFGNQTGGSGPFAVLNSFCYSDGSVTDDSSLVTPSMDFSGLTTAAIRWDDSFVDMESGTFADVDLSTDGGASWTNIWRAPGDLPGPNTQIADMSAAAGQPDVRARFHYQGFWAWWWQVDDVEVGAFACTPIPGGLVVGNVSDANTGAGLNGATVSNPPAGGSTATIPTPDDPAQPDGLFILFSESGAQSLEAAYPAHQSGVQNVTVIPNSTIRADFSLSAGMLSASPLSLSVLASPGAAQELTLNLSNAGTGPAGFDIRELNLPAPTVSPVRPVHFANVADRKAALKRLSFDRMNDRSSRGLALPPKSPVHVPAIATAGRVVASFPTGLASGWGLSYDTKLDRLWISNPDRPDFGFNGDGLEHQYLLDGTPTGETIDIHATGGFWQADGTYNLRSGKLWQVNVGDDNCLFEMDPVAKVVTGKTMCGTWAASAQRGVAYDYATDTYFVGGINDATIYHLDGSGNVLDSKYVGLSISGLAFNPTTRHLFLNTEFAAPFQIWVLDASNDYAVLGGFVVTDGGGNALPNGAVSLEASCDGRLWVTDETTQTVYGFESGETGWCASDIPWLSETPAAGSVGSGGTVPVTVTFDPAGLLPGYRQGSLLVLTDTPDTLPVVPVDFTLLFNDVAQDSFAWNYIYGAAGAGVMPGCAPQTPDFLFCPGLVVTRRSMAGFIERALHGAQTPPPVYLGEFGDVFAGSFNANYIQGLVDDGITAGCGVSPPLYCPDAPVSRAQMAVFVWKARHGDEAPPSCLPPGDFADVPCPGGFAVDYIEAIAAEGITAGCGNGNYCPDAGITNAQMAVYMVKAFQIPYLP